jgi:hypothetical protein
VLLLQAFLQAAMGLLMQQALRWILQHQQQLQLQLQMAPRVQTAATLQGATGGG